MNRNSFLPFYIFSFSVAIVLTLSSLIKNGMFFDAVLYQSVANNMAGGIGSFWFPFFDENNLVGLPSFHEQPPLVFFIQSLFYRILGNSMYVERFYAFTMLIINASLILKIWITLFKKEEKMKEMGWLAIILWITIPICFWSYANCMHEITMSVFTSLSILFFIKNYYQQESPFYLFTGSFMAVLAFMCKGFPGLYPIGIPFIYWICTKKITFKKMLSNSLISVSILVLFFVFVWLNENAHKSIIDYYLIKRAFHRISEDPTTDNRFFIFFRLLSELIPAFLLTTLLLLFAMIKDKWNLFYVYKNEFILFILIGASGSLPIMLTTVQKGFYMVASLQNFGIAFAILLSPLVHFLIEKKIEKNYKKFLITSCSILGLVFLFIFSQIGKYSRDENIIFDTNKIKSVIPKNEYIQAAGIEELTDYPFKMYMMRYNYIGIRNKKSNYYFILKSKSFSTNYSLQKINIETKVYDFYKQIE